MSGRSQRLMSRCMRSPNSTPSTLMSGTPGTDSPVRPAEKISVDVVDVFVDRWDIAIRGHSKRRVAVEDLPGKGLATLRACKVHDGRGSKSVEILAVAAGAVHRPKRAPGAGGARVGEG